MKKFTLLIASLFITIGAMAQTATTYADGVYKIFWQHDQRGYLTYHADYPNDPQLAGVVNHNPNGHYQLTDEGIQLSWYLYTSAKTSKSYLFEATTGKFITIDMNTASANGKRCALSEEVSEFAQFDLKATTNTTAYMLSYGSYNFCSGCGTNKGAGPVRFTTDQPTDGGIPFVFVTDGASITDDVKNAAIAKIEAYESNVLTKISDFYEAATTFDTYEGTISNIVNGNTGDKWWSNGAQEVEKTITVKLNDVHQVGIIKWYFCDNDKPHGATIERKATADGEEWINVADFTIDDIKNNVFTCTAGGNDVKELRLRITAAHSNWLQVAEVELYEFIDVDKTGLQELIVEAENLFDQISSSEKIKGDNEIELSGKISSNAAQNNADGNTGGDNDGAGIAGLIDNDPSTYFHSRWGGAAIDEDHYLQIDLGDGNKLSDFVFEYAVRKAGDADHTSPAPTSIEVRVSEDGADFGDPIVTLTATDNNLPSHEDLGNTLWCSDVIEAGINARYIRFTVTGSNGPGEKIWNNHYFFAMGTLNLYPTKNVKVIADNYEECITEELFNAYVEAINEAKSVNENLEAMPNDVETASEELANQLAAIKAVLTHPLTVTAAGYATLYLGFDAAIPTGAEAYIVKQSDINEGYITMTKIEGTIPANTGVIVKANPEKYGFAYSAENKADVTGNLLDGSVADEYVEGAAYVLGNKEGVGLYKAALNKDEAGEEGTTHFKNNANKAYLPASALTPVQQTAAFYGFDWNGTTGIEKVEIRNEKSEIYDLTGRRVEEITEPGIYIVNGVKKLVR